MPRYRIQIFKRLGPGGKEYSNVYHLIAGDLSQADSAARDIAMIESNVTPNNVTFIRARTSDETPASDLYVTTPLNYLGALDTNPELLPPFNTVRVDFTVGGGRPSYKFLRNIIGESNYTQGGLTSGSQAFIQENYADALMAALGDATMGVHITDEDGLPFSDALVWPLVQMRQTYRRRRARTS